MTTTTDSPGELANRPPAASMKTKVERVRSYFESPNRYLVNGYASIRIRTELTQEFLRDSRFDSILDIGCGDGSLSLPHLTLRNRLTLLDLSKNMLLIARSRIPAELSPNVQMVNEDFMSVELPDNAYDLVLCVGVLAHLDDSFKAIAKIASLLRPGGSLIVETADSRHFLTWIWRFRTNVLGAVSGRYPLKRIPHSALLDEFDNLRFVIVGSYRYSIGLPGMSWIFNQSQLYRGIRAIYGTSTSNRTACLGNEILYHLRYLP